MQSPIRTRLVASAFAVGMLVTGAAGTGMTTNAATPGEYTVTYTAVKGSDKGVANGEFSATPHVFPASGKVDTSGDGTIKLSVRSANDTSELNKDVPDQPEDHRHAGLLRVLHRRQDRHCGRRQSHPHPGQDHARQARHRPEGRCEQGR